MTDHRVEGSIDVESAVRELGDRVALIKAHIVGRERIAESNAMPWTDAEQREQVFAGMGVITPPYDPETLAILFENSSPVIDLDASDADLRIANALIVERQRKKADPRFRDDPELQALATTPTPEEIVAKKAEVTEHMQLERSRLETFFDFCCVDLSFVTLRRRTRQDIEVMGNGYWEVLRDGAGDIVQLVYLPGFTMRLLPLELALVEVDVNLKISEIAFDTMKVRRRFRRYVQVFEQQVVYFKEFGDPRVLSRKTGRFFRSVDEFEASDATDGPATEILHFKLHNARSAYGTPRWIGNLLAVLGSRQAEEVNFLYFENKSVPPLALLVSGGRLSAQSVPRIESYIENHIKGKRNFHKILVLEAEPAGGTSLDHTGRMKIELRPLTNAQQSDATFLNYDEIEKFRDRLRAVTVRSGHYASVVKEFDGKDTFFFLDPPYPGHNVEVGEDRFDEAEFRKILDGIKGKFLVTYGTRGELDTAGFHVRKIRTRRSIACMRGVGGPKTLPQLLIANYAITQKALGPYVLDEIDATVELSPGAASDLDLARVLAKALAQESDEPSIFALADELDHLDDAGDERAAVLARELLPLTGRLAPALEAVIPDLATVLHDAKPALEGLAKTEARPGDSSERPGPEFPIASEARGLLAVALSKHIPLLKTVDERYVLGIVLEPETVDAQEDIYSAAEIRDAAHRFMEEYQNIGLMHRDLVNGRVKVLESYLAPTAFELDGTKVRKGTWLLAVRVLDDNLWAQIKAGELSGLSIGGSAVRSAEPATGRARPSA